jgi:hypothetical protein
VGTLVKQGHTVQIRTAKNKWEFAFRASSSYDEKVLQCASFLPVRMLGVRLELALYARRSKRKFPLVLGSADLHGVALLYQRAHAQPSARWLAVIVETKLLRAREKISECSNRARARDGVKHRL